MWAQVLGPLESPCWLQPSASKSKMWGKEGICHRNIVAFKSRQRRKSGPISPSVSYSYETHTIVLSFYKKIKATHRWPQREKSCDVV